MGSFFNFKNFEDTQHLDCSSGKVTTTGDVPLARQSSIYSLTFDELQGTFSGLGKDFGSMNMEDLLKKNIWMAEESQAFASTAGVGNGITPSGNLQRQGSLTLPRTLSQKTVDEVWRDMFKESTTSTFDGDSAGGSSFGQRQNTLGEMTLEDFLQRAGVAKEEPQQIVKLETAGFYGALAQPCSSSSLSIGFQPVPNQKALGNQFLENINPVPNSSDIILNLGGTDTSRKEQHKEVPSQHQSLFSNGASLTFSSGVPPTNNNNYQISSPQTKVAVVAMSKSSMNSTLVQHSPIPEGAAGLAGLSYLPASRVAISPGNHMPSNAIANRKLDILPVSPLYTVGEGGRGRRSNSSLEKVVERRRKRMIKNRESAARSRSRKQAYTLELEAEIANLKELNQNLKKKQAEFIEMQKDQVLETEKIPLGGKRRCLERTLTGPW
ncbi:hypothetical protein Leryth_004320 [Lithospermum erythrorhizon]|nr:hypothetical protein Leryth_004320 [Lithospermum erythrorhizon]